MNRNQGKIVIGMIVAGLIILLGKLGFFSFVGHAFWPLLILLPGIMLQLFYFSRSIPSYLLVPAGILTVYGVLFFLCNTWGWWLMDYLWPLLITGIALGLYEYYAMSPFRVDGRIGITAILLGLLSAVLLLISILGSALLYIIAILLVVSVGWIFFTQNGYKRPRL
ncbi:hypothetical protein [Paenibacillus sp. WLX2291]|uniref:hypothetical protein n=1 Tax=Paenibacillus sp. WLX2291 TaxID=3296934 RepID=UPI0039840E3B